MTAPIDNGGQPRSGTLGPPPGYVLLRTPDSHRGLERVKRLAGEVGLHLACGPLSERFGVVIAPAALEEQLRAVGCTRPRSVGRLWLWWSPTSRPADHWTTRERALAIGALG